MNVPRLILNDGHTMPQLGAGVWQVPDRDTGEAVRAAAAMGFRLFDGAFIYGNERGLGEGIHTSGVARGELFITTKVWNADQGRARARGSVMRSLDTMKLSYLDLVLIHWPCPLKNLYRETWEVLVQLRDEGLVRSIGVSNFNPDHLNAVIADTGVTPVLNQIEVNPRMQNTRLRTANVVRGVISQNWSPLGEGKSFAEPAIQQAANRTGRSPAQVVLRWHLQLGSSVIPRAVRPGHLGQNIDIFDFALTEAEMGAIAALDRGERCGPDPVSFEQD
jgi:2,5-diketo-D-gluconate reductase A